MPSQGDLVLRLLLAVALTGALGFEREISDHPAGFRTHVLVGLGSALFAVISAFGFQAIAAHGPAPEVRADVSRVASQIVVGIGFLGGGAILKYGANVKGLTTAANLWVAAAIGTAAGIGMLLVATSTTLIALLALTLLRPLRVLIRRAASATEEFLVEADSGLELDALLRDLSSSAVLVRNMRVEREGSGVVVELQVRIPKELTPADVIATLAARPNIRNVERPG